MICANCKTINSDNVKFCKSCGSQLTGAVMKCKNGHSYDPAKGACPFCPPEADLNTILDDNPLSGTAAYMNTFSDPADRTIIDSTKPTYGIRGQGGFAGDSDRTVIMPPAEGGPADSAQHGDNQTVRRLVGWFVTFDLSPAGTDFRLYEGRSTIGRNQRCDIILRHGGISDEHAILLYRGDKFYIKDNLSSNGTVVNDVLLEPDQTLELKDNDIVKIGTITLKFKKL